MSSITSSPDSSQNPAINDPRPPGQRDRAAHAHLDPNDPAKDAEAGTPHYGNFGEANEAEPAIPTAGAGGNDGSNDNPDEFSEFHKSGEKEAKPYQVNPADFDPASQEGHVDQNQAPDEVRAAQHADTDVRRAAWADDDARYAGGHAKASWTEENDNEHDKND